MPYIGSTPTKVVSRQSATVYRYTATAGQTVFSGADLDNNVLACNPADMIVHMNGLRLESTDYTATSTTVTLTTAATAGDEVTVTSFQTFEVADTYTKTAADSRYVNTTGDTMTGTLNATGMARNTNGLRIGASNASTGYGLRIGASGATDPLEIWRDHANGDQMQLSVDYYGRVTMPYQPAFFARDGSGFNTNGYLSSFGVVQHNIGGHFNNSTGQFTAPVSGKYLFTAGVLVQTGTGRLEFKLNYNGTTIASGNGTGTTYDGPTITVIINMNVNDYIRVDRVLGTAYSNGNHSNTYFSGYLIG